MSNRILLNSNQQKKKIYWESLKRKSILIFMTLQITFPKNNNTSLNFLMEPKKYKNQDMKRSSFLQEKIKLKPNLFKSHPCLTGCSQFLQASRDSTQFNQKYLIIRLIQTKTCWFVLQLLLVKPTLPYFLFWKLLATM